jgi:hypothetical protein
MAVIEPFLKALVRLARANLASWGRDAFDPDYSTAGKLLEVQCRISPQLWVA